jgi:rubrerythrin
MRPLSRFKLGSIANRGKSRPAGCKEYPPFAERSWLLFTLKDIIAVAVQIEHNGEEIYRAATMRNPSASLSGLLSWIADEEARHGEWFEALARKTPSVKVDGAMEKMSRIMLRSSVEEQTFSLEEADLSSVEAADRLLAMTIEFEKDTVAFYQMMRAFLQDADAIEALDRIVEEERHHIEALAKMREEMEVQ